MRFKPYILLLLMLCMPMVAISVVYTQNQCLNGTATASSQYSASYAAQYAFDGVVDELNGWYTANGNTTGILEYEFLSAKTIEKYTLKLRDYSTADESAPAAWTLEGWDGASWVELDIHTGVTDWIPLDEKSYEFTNGTAYTRYRLNITANNGHTFVGIAEMEMYEEAVYIGGGGHESVWHFGFGAGVDFRYDPPLGIDGSNMDQWEGCASICDQQGDLLFYTNGVSVWNANHATMPNGTGLYGSISSTQSGVIVPHPGDPDTYYIFTLYRNGDYEIGHKGLCYSIVDMTLDGGLGDVVSGQKNIELNNPNTEKITSIKHSNESDIWVVTHDWGNNKFLAYLIDDTGLNTTPVESSAGIVHYDNFNGWYSAGYMKVAPSGDRIALNVLGAATTQLFDFNPATGVVSNPMTLSTTRTQAYGIEFSPDGSTLYTTAWEYNNVLQYDLSLTDEASIAVSETEIGVSALSGGSNYNGLGALQVAPDGNIYVAKDANGMGGSVNDLNSWLGVIENPNDAASGTKSGPIYKDNGIYLGNNASGIGLPTYVQTYFSPMPVEMIEFVVDAKHDDTATLTWKTMSEFNSDYYEIQKSVDGFDFDSIGKVKAAGFSKQLKAYDFVDPGIVAGLTYYYRLKQVDIDGKYEYFGPVSLHTNEDDIEFCVLDVYPVPFSDILSLKIKADTKKGLKVNLKSVSGQLLFSKTIYVNSGVGIYQIVPRLNVSGMFLLEIYSETDDNAYAEILIRH
ncbi:MAG: discoidin domain-containing protein [Candidatus Delongbacteria bacterium]|nr:discoidin domain-containing protein [Candidatus Delongbacteria bacterium]